MKSKYLIFIILFILVFNLSHSQISDDPTPALRTFGYYIDTINGSYPCKFFLNNPSSITPLGSSSTVYYIRGGTWFNGKYYCTATATTQNYIFYVDTSTGTRQNFTLISIPSSRIEGITWCPDDTPYIYFTYINNNLTNNLAKYYVTGDFYNAITSINHTSILRNLAASNNGTLYSIDETGMLGTVNKTNGAWTNIGQTGITIDNYDGLEFDRTSNTLYCSAHGSLYSINISNGSSTLIGNFTNNARINALAIVFTLPLKIEQIGEKIPKAFYLSQNYPNPFNPSTNIEFDLPKSTNVKIIIYDVMGKEIKMLVNEMKHAGSYKVLFDGSIYSSGLYFYKIEAGDFVETKKLVLLK